MKKLFAVLFAIQLILSPVAYAQAPQGSNTIDAYRVSGNGSRGGYDFYIKQVMMIASGIVGTNTLTGKPKHYLTLSPYIFGAGAVVLLISEIDGALQTNKYHEKKMKELKLDQNQLDQIYELGKLDKETANFQLSAVTKMIEEEENNIKFLNKRKKWADAVEIVYWSAVGMTAIEIIFDYIPNTLTPYDIDIFDYGAPQDNVGFEINSAGLGKVMKQVLYLTYFASPLLIHDITNNNSKGLMSVGGTVATTAITTAVLGGGMKAGFQKLTKTMDKFDETVNKTLTKAMKTPISRAITFGVFAGLASLVSQGLKDRMKIAEDNKGKLKKLEADLKAVTNTNTIEPSGDTPELDELAGNGPKPNGPTRGKLKDLPDGARVKVCDGKCLGDLKTKKAQFAKIKIPLVLNQSINDSIGMAEGFDNDDMGKADFHAGSLSANAAKTRATVEELIKQANSKMKSHGGKEIDFKAEVAKELAAFTKAAEASAVAAGYGPNSGDKVDLAPAAVEKEIVPEVAVAAPAGAVAPGEPVDPLAGLGSEVASEVPAEAAVAASEGDNLDNYESTAQDISKSSDVSIFKQLSNRYILNYTKIFERKKAPQPAPEEAKN